MRLIDTITIDPAEVQGGSSKPVLDSGYGVMPGGMNAASGYQPGEWFNKLNSEAAKGGKKWQWGLLELLFIAGIAGAIFIVVKLVK